MTRRAAAVAAALVLTGCGGESAGGEGDRLFFAQRVAVAGDRILLAGVATKGDENESCREEGRAQELSVVGVDETGRVVAGSSVPQGEIEGCVDAVGPAALDADQRLLVAASFTEWPPRFSLGGEGGPKVSSLVARFTRDGELDDSFGNDGVELNPRDEVFATQPGGFELAVAPAPGGRLVVVDNYPHGGATLERVAGDGRSTKLGNVAGVPRSAVFETGVTWELHVDRKRGVNGFGGFYPAEESGDEVYVVFRHRLADGRPDQAFGSEGFHDVELPRARFVTARDSALQADGKILVAGVAQRGSRTVGFVERLTAKGTPDRGFGKSGFAEFELGRATEHFGDAGAALAVDDRGRIVFAGWRKGDGTTLLRLEPDGRPDRSFGDAGRLVVGRI